MTATDASENQLAGARSHPRISYRDTVGPYRPAARKLVETGYRTLDFPFAEKRPPAFVMHVDWPMDRLLGYFSSWPATARYRKVRGEDPVAALAETLRAAWGDPLSPRAIT